MDCYVIDFDKENNGLRERKELVLKRKWLKMIELIGYQNRGSWEVTSS